jgi:hypothetical protein
MVRSIPSLACAALVALAAACGDAPGPTGPQAAKPVDNQFATGTLRTKYIFGTNVVDNYTFSAVKDDSGNVSGGFAMMQARFFSGLWPESAARVMVFGQIVCLEVQGHIARIGGFVTASNFEPGIAIGAPITFSVSDNSGTASPDAASPLLGGVDPYAYCSNGLPYPEHPLNTGDVTVIEDDGR